MRTFRWVGVGLLVVGLLTGCAATKAFEMPPPVRDDLIELGMDRGGVEAYLTVAGPADVEMAIDGTDSLLVAHYTYADGPNEVWKLRGLFYLLADVWTLFLSELIFWPAEIIWTSTTTRSATAYYDVNDRLVYFQAVKGRDDSVIRSLGVRSFPLVSEATEIGIEEVESAEEWLLVGRTLGRTLAIAEGEFWSGCNRLVDRDCFGNEAPRKDRFVEAFRIGETEVTVSAFRECVESEACDTPGDGAFCNWNRADPDLQPQNCIDWFEASAFCAWKGGRLPTEWEWEKAARGSDGRRYPWGSEGADCLHAVIRDGSDTCGHDSSTAEVGTKPHGRSPDGLHDMMGNVSEWTSTLASDASNRVVRGGSWIDDAKLSRVSLRGQYPADSRAATIGFRCVESVANPEISVGLSAGRTP